METHAEHKVDRAGWDPGPWDNEPDKLVWKTETGLPGMIVRNSMGALCGYVGVTKDHPWYGRAYNDGDYPDSPEGRLSAHGGITYSDKCQGHICHVPEPGEPDDVWWFGFDCNHCDDYAPVNAKYRKMAGSGRTPELYRQRPSEVYRDLAYVRGEVEDLARQLIENRATCAEKE